MNELNCSMGLILLIGFTSAFTACSPKESANSIDLPVESATQSTNRSREVSVVPQEEELEFLQEREAKDENQLLKASDFDAGVWIREGEVVVRADAASDPNNEGMAQEISMMPKALIMQSGIRAATAGKRFNAEIWLWSDAPTTVSLEVGRHGGNSEYEGRIYVAELTETPTLYKVTHRFENTHPSGRILLRNRTDSEISFYAWNASVVVK